MKLGLFPTSEVRNRRRNKNLLQSDVEVGRQLRIAAFPEAASRESELQLQDPAESTRCRAGKHLPQYTRMNIALIAH